LTPLALDLIRWFAYALLVASIVPVCMVISQLVRARRAPYYALRREALGRARRWLLAALILEAVAVLLLIGGMYLVIALRAPSPPPAPTSTPPPPPTATPRPTRTPTVTPTRRPTATPPFIPTSTPAIPLPESALSPLPSAVPAREGARIAVITLAADKTDSGEPVDPGTEFPPGGHRVYLFVSYEGMTNGVAWTFVVYHEGKLLDQTTQLWEWGEKGRTYLYYQPPQGYEPGIHEMAIFIESHLQRIAQFVITEE